MVALLISIFLAWKLRLLCDVDGISSLNESNTSYIYLDISTNLGTDIRILLLLITYTVPLEVSSPLFMARKTALN